MDEQKTNPRIIIDASYIRTASDGEPFRAICEQGGRIVITDTLLWELASTDGYSTHWPKAIKKLKAGVDTIEIWRHGPVMWREELKKNCPYGDPLHPEETTRWRKQIANDSLLQPRDFDAEIAKEYPIREGKSIIKLFQNLACNFSLSERLPKKNRKSARG